MTFPPSEEHATSLDFEARAAEVYERFRDRAADQAHDGDDPALLLTEALYLATMALLAESRNQSRLASDANYRTLMDRR